MTKLNGNRALVRETALEVQGAPLVIAMRSRYLSIRPKGTHEWFALDYEAIYQAACKRDALLKLDARRSA